MKLLNLYTAVIIFTILGISVSAKDVNAQRETDIDGNYIENPVEDAADREDADFIEGDEDVSVTETKEDGDGDTSVVEETNENYADEMDKDILEDSVDTTDALEPQQPERQ
ncbi:hypothetical protein [Myxosarcina sp. GI1]|uniref:hypothetical protein n=1 Tax=Myxosarcina sp. GI1 TaxID=1541065 RepID=UPI0005661B4A|nr:hypothetical protein [Myxosarcina sp. GI1]